MGLTGLDDELSVHGDVVDAGTGLVRLIVGGPVGNRGGIEDHEVGKGSFADHATAREAEPLGWSAAQFVDRIFQRKEPGISHHGAEQWDRRAIDSWMEA